MRRSLAVWHEAMDGRAGALPVIHAEGSDLTYDCHIVQVFAVEGFVPPRRGRLLLRCATDGTVTARLAPTRRRSTR
jgi:hypothetical protein